MSHRALLLCITLLSIASGCASSKTVTIVADPPDAVILVDGKSSGIGRTTQTFTFPDPRRVHSVLVSRRGYEDERKVIGIDFAPSELLIRLKNRSRKVSFTIRPQPAILTDNGKPLTTERVSFFSVELPFTVDSRGNWTTHTIMAERTNYANAKVEVSFIDPHEPNYVLELQPMKKNLVITTNPPGANIYLDNEFVGPSPITDNAHAFAVNPETDQFIPVKVKVKKPGYADVEREIGWDDAQTDYQIDIVPKQKNVRIVSNPPGATITLDGKELPNDSDGAAIASLKYEPLNEKGELPVYRGTAMKRGAELDWQPVDVAIPWDEGKTDYAFPLKEVLTKPVPLLTATWLRSENGVWDVEPRMTMTLAMKKTGEATPTQKAVQLAKAPSGTSIDTIVVSPDGGQLLYTTLYGNDRASFRSQMNLINTNGGGGVGALFDGKSLDLYPSFTPGGESIVFSSNRMGKRMSVWQAASSGAPGISQVTTGDANEVWPDVDSDPRPRVYYQALIDSRPDPRIFSSQLGTTLRTDMQISGTQPRVSPRNDSVVYCGVNERTGKRDLFRVPAGGGQPQNLTNTPDADEYDPCWSHDGNRIAFASDEGTEAVERRRNAGVWIMDVNRTGSKTRITSNGSQDDCPQWDPAGKFIYFRSNRGGEWGVWKIAVK